MAITLNGTTGVTTPAVSGDGSGLTALPAAQLTGTVATSQIADANVTTAKIADANVTTAKIADANVTQGKLADQAVNEAKLQVSNAPTNGYMLTAESGNTGGLTWAAAPTSSTTNGAVGTYGFFYKYSSVSYYMGGTLAGSSLYPSSVGVWYTGTTMSGTWRAMGHTTNYSVNNNAKSLWVRIS